MNLFTHLLVASAFATGSLLPISSFAQATTEHDHSHASEVKKLDLAQGKVTIKHGEIKHLDMPGMTMVFTVRDKGLLATVKPGDKIKFMAVSEGGKLIVTDIQPIR